jgi:hypothetical protein
MHTYVHHIGITILLLSSYTSSTLLGRPAGSDPSRLTQQCSYRIYANQNKTFSFIYLGKEFNSLYWLTKKIKKFFLCYVLLLNTATDYVLSRYLHCRGSGLKIYL